VFRGADQFSVILAAQRRDHQQGFPLDSSGLGEVKRARFNTVCESITITLIVRDGVLRVDVDRHAGVFEKVGGTVPFAALAFVEDHCHFTPRRARPPPFAIGAL